MSRINSRLNSKLEEGEKGRRRDQLYRFVKNRIAFLIFYVDIDKWMM